MTWLQRQFGAENPNDSQQDYKDEKITHEELMSPGLTGEYDRDLREKAGMRQPPILPHNMGIDGEYDVNGLAKRVAAAFDQNPEIQDISTLEIVQDDSKISLKGSIQNQSILDQMVDLASRVDGTKIVDTSEVTIEVNS
jgi:hypothetical protein